MTRVFEYFVSFFFSSRSCFGFRAVSRLVFVSRLVSRLASCLAFVLSLAFRLAACFRLVSLAFLSLVLRLRLVLRLASCRCVLRLLLSVPRARLLSVLSRLSHGLASCRLCLVLRLLFRSCAVVPSALFWREKKAFALSPCFPTQLTRVFLGFLKYI